MNHDRERDESSRPDEDSEVEEEGDLSGMDIEESERDLGLGTQENKAPGCESIEAVAANGSRAIPAVAFVGAWGCCERGRHLRRRFRALWGEHPTGEGDMQ